MKNTSFLQLQEWALKATQHAALAAFDWVGRGQQNEADAVAVEAMRSILNAAPINGTVVIGEGERDEAPMLYIGEMLGLRNSDSIAIDIAVDPLEGTSLCANALEGALSVIAIAPSGSLLKAPDLYMEKIAVGPHVPLHTVSLDYSIEENLKRLSKAIDKDISEICVLLLNRPRHHKLINDIRAAGAKVRLIQDGDVAGVISLSWPVPSGIDMYIGIGGAPEGVLAAAALKVLGGYMECRLQVPDNDKAHIFAIAESERNKKYSIEDMVRGEVIFAATGITGGELVEGVKKDNAAHRITHSIVLCSQENKMKEIKERFI
jgi:fructose-1,6-bisphosphatase II / sedoheptulose-1,7-bisphosphatase